jgi:hypothetical protein
MGLINPIISLDIETLNMDMKKEKLKFDDPKGWKTSVVCIHDNIKEKNYIYVSMENYAEVTRLCGGKIGFVYPFNMLEHHLSKWLGDGYTILTHNGLGFDLPIISKSIIDGGVGCEAILKTWPKMQMVDTCHVLTEATGVRYRLNHLIHSMLGIDESKLMDAADAPKAWAKEKYEEVIRYCIDDTMKTLQVYFKAGELGGFSAIGKEDYRFVSSMEFVQNWLKWAQH